MKNSWKEKGLPASTVESDAMSKDLAPRFQVRRTTIRYAFMQATGLVDDRQGKAAFSDRNTSEEVAALVT
jgi:3-methyladenine DNA glycosylase Tag